ncbi:hypothetical protein ABK040_008442 [Willaertia magna]
MTKTDNKKVVHHPRSRKAEQATREGIHKLKKKEQQKQREKLKIQPQHKRYLFFYNYIFENNNFPENTFKLTEEQIHEMILNYLKKLEDDFDKKHPKPSPNQRLKRESIRAIYQTGDGIECPDFTKDVIFSKFRTWNKEKESMQGFPVKKFRKPSSSTTTNNSSNAMQN